MKDLFFRFAFSVFAVLFLVSAAGLSATVQEKYTLKNQYPPGQYEMVQNTDMDMIVEMSGTNAKMPMKTKQTQYITIDAAAKNTDGTQKIVMEITRIAMDQKMSMMHLKYDSADPEAGKSPMKAAGVVVGLKITMLFGKDGEIQKVEGIDEFFEKLVNNPDYPKPVAEMLKEQMTNESMTKAVDIVREIMPKVTVAVGETWNTEGSSEVPIVGKTKTKLENTLKEVKTENGRKIAVILSKSVSRSEDPQEVGTAAGKMTFTKMDVRSENTVLMDIESGLLMSNAADMSMAMEMSMTVGNKTVAQKVSGTGKTTVMLKPKTTPN